MINPRFSALNGDSRFLLKEDNSTMATSCLVSYSGDDILRAYTCL